MFKNFLTSLNGWQRIFVVLVIFVQIPITLAMISNIEGKITKIKSVDELNEKLQEHLAKNNHNLEKYLEENNFENATPVNLDEYIKDKTIEKNNSIVKIRFNSQNKKWSYVLIANKSTTEDELVIDAKFIQQLIDGNSKQTFPYLEYLETIITSILISLVIYIFGFSIGWIVKGFKRK